MEADLTASEVGGWRVEAGGGGGPRWRKSFVRAPSRLLTFVVDWPDLAVSYTHSQLRQPQLLPGYEGLSALLNDTPALNQQQPQLPGDRRTRDAASVCVLVAFGELSVVLRQNLLLGPQKRRRSNVIMPLLCLVLIATEPRGRDAGPGKQRHSC